MRLIGALALGICVFFAVGLAMGRAPRIRIGLGRNKPHSAISNRQIWLTQAGLDLTPAQYYFGLGGIGLVIFAIVSAITATPVTALAPAAVALVLPHVFFSRRRSRNVSKAQRAWPDTLRELIASIESNSSLHNAMAQIAYRGPDGLRQAFERFPTMATTIGVVPALESVRERLGDPTSDRVIEVLILAHERGGTVVTEILRNLVRTTNEDLELDEEVETAQLEQKLNSRAVFVIPWALLILLVLSDPDFKTFYQSAGGYAVVIVGAILSSIGMLLMARLSKMPPELRVFGGSALSMANDTDEFEDIQ